MFNFKTPRTLPQLRVEVSDAISLRVASIEEGRLALSDLEAADE